MAAVTVIYTCHSDVFKFCFHACDALFPVVKRPTGNNPNAPDGQSTIESATRFMAMSLTKDEELHDKKAETIMTAVSKVKKKTMEGIVKGQLPLERVYMKNIQCLRQSIENSSE